MASLLWSREAEFAFVTLGIYTSYLCFGYAQESVYTKVTGTPHFTYSEFMVFIQCFVGYFVAEMGDWAFPGKKEVVGVDGNSAEQRETARKQYQRKQVLHALIYVGAMVCTNTSLLYVSYPTQALAKSCKILPIMLSGLFVKQIKYHWLQYLSVAMITLGVLEFQLIGGKSGGSDSFLGLFLLFLALTCDGMSGYLTVSDKQEVIRHEQKPTSFQMMRYLNLYSWIATGVGVLVLSLGHHPEPIWVYLMANHTKLLQVLLYGFASAIGQMFIFRAIVSFGTLTLAVITTTRKFFTVFLSIFMFSHSLTASQWWCVALVLSGSTLDGASKYLVPAEKVKK